jgi:hypothetical protein
MLDFRQILDTSLETVDLLPPCIKLPPQLAKNRINELRAISRTILPTLACLGICFLLLCIACQIRAEFD